MNISRPANSTFVVLTKNTEEIELVINPAIEKQTASLPRAKSNVYLSTTIGLLPEVFFNKEGVLAIHSAGEFELKKIFILGIPCETKGSNTPSVIFVIESEGMRLCALGQFGQGKLSTEQLEAIGAIDIAIIPVGESTLTPIEAAGIVEQMEPRIIILHGQGKQFSEDSMQFSKKTGLHPESMEKIKITKKDLPQEETKLIFLTENK